jgi:hypothetical protein
MANESASPTSAKLLATLKQHDPTKVLAYSGDGDPRIIAVPTRRKKWSQVVANVEARSWSHCELVDKHGAVLAYVENSDAATELEDLPAGSKMASEYALAVRVSELVLKGQREARADMKTMLDPFLNAQAATLASMTEAMRATVDMYREQVELTDEAAEARAQVAEEAAAVAAAAKESGFGMQQFKELVEAAPAIMQFVAMMKKQLAGGTEAPAPNGKRS